MTTSSLVDSTTTTAASQSQVNVIPKYRLIVRQQPEKSRLCSFKEKGEPLHYAKWIAGRWIHHLLYNLKRIKESGDEDLTFVENIRMTAGTTVQSLHRLRDCDNEEGAFFIFADISIRMEGFFRLRFTLFEIVGLYATSRCSVLSGVFQVYSPKSFPGMSESTFLTRSFSEQGVRIRIRKETRSNTSSPSKRRRSDGNQDSIATTPQARHHSLPVIHSTQSIMSVKNILISPVQESSSQQTSSSNRFLPLPSHSSSDLFNCTTDSSTAPLCHTNHSSLSPLLESSSSPSSSRTLYPTKHLHSNPDHRLQ